MKTRLDSVIKSLSVTNAAIKNTASPIEKDGWYPAFSASGQDAWLPDYRFDQKGLVVSAVGARCGKVFKADGKWNVCANTHALSVDENIADRDYCWYLLNNEEWWIKGGTAQPFVKVKDSLKREHEFPPLDKQRRIVHELDQISFIIAKRQKELLILDDLIKARFIQLLQPFFDEKKTEPLSNLINKDRPITYGILKPGKNVDGGLPVIRVKDFSRGLVTVNDVLHTTPEIYRKYLRSTLEEGDIIISIGGTIGRIAIIPKEFCGANITQHTARISLQDKRHLSYYKGLFESDIMQRWMKSHVLGVAQPSMNLGDVKQMPIPKVDECVMSELDSFTKQVDKSKAIVQAALDKSQLLFDYLMQQYFG